LANRYAIIENNLIVNVIVAEEDFISANYPNAIQSPEHICVGDKYENGEFIKVLNIDEDEAETL